MARVDMDTKRLMTRTLKEQPWGSGVARILAAALKAVDPYQAVRRNLSRQEDRLQVAGIDYSLGGSRRVYLVGAGKAGFPMAQAAAEVVGDRLQRGVVVVKEGYVDQSTGVGNVKVLEAGHPLPDSGGVEGTRHIAELLAGTTEGDLVVALISGGGSALLTLPVPGGQAGKRSEGSFM